MEIYTNCKTLLYSQVILLWSLTFYFMRVCLHVCMYTVCASFWGSGKREWDPPGVRVTGGYEPSFQVLYPVLTHFKDRHWGSRGADGVDFSERLAHTPHQLYRSMYLLCLKLEKCSSYYIPQLPSGTSWWMRPIPSIIRQPGGTCLVHCFKNKAAPWNPALTVGETQPAAEAPFPAECTCCCTQKMIEFFCSGYPCANWGQDMQETHSKVHTIVPCGLVLLVWGKNICHSNNWKEDEREIFF